MGIFDPVSPAETGKGRPQIPKGEVEGRVDYGGVEVGSKETGVDRDLDLAREEVKEMPATGKEVRAVPKEMIEGAISEAEISDKEHPSSEAVVEVSKYLTDEEEVTQANAKRLTDLLNSINRPENKN